MATLLGILRRAAVSGTVAAATSGVALAALARGEGRGTLQPINATSHWRSGPAAAGVRAADPAHTGVGAGTHLAATLFWAALFEGWNARRPRAAPSVRVRDAAAVAVLAAAADYIATPRRFTPGWEYVLSRRSMAAAYAALGAGLALGTIALDRAGD